MLRKGFPAQRRLLSLEPLVDELVVGEAEVIEREAQRQVDVVHAEPRVFGNDVDLRGLLGIVFLQGLEVRNREDSSISPDVQGHGRPEDTETAVERDDLLLVHPQQRAVDERLCRLVLQLRLQRQVVLDGPLKRTVGGFHQQIDATNVLGHLANQMFEESRRTVPAKSGDTFDARPVPPQPNRDGLHVARADFDTSFRVRFVTPVGGDAAQKPDQPLGQRVAVTFLTKALRKGPERETGPFIDLLVGRLLAKLCNERLLELLSERQAARGGVLDSRMHIHGDAHVVRRDTDFLERAEHLAKLLQRVSSASRRGSFTCARASAGSWYCFTR